MSIPTNRKDKICFLLKGIETGDAESAEVVSEEKYIQHNPQTTEGSEGLASLFKRLSKTSPRVNIVRIFEDGDYVFGHTEYEFDTSRVGFEVFRFEGDYAVEHWDNIQPRKGPNPSAHSMVDGATMVDARESTESNRLLVRSFVDEVLIENQFDLFEKYIDDKSFIEHSPQGSDGMEALNLMLTARLENGSLLLEYHKMHRVLAEGNFVLTVCEGGFNGIHSSFYDLFRVEQDRIVEHWDTREAVPAPEEWKNNNGKF